MLETKGNGFDVITEATLGDDDKLVTHIQAFTNLIYDCSLNIRGKLFSRNEKRKQTEKRNSWFNNLV